MFIGHIPDVGNQALAGAGVTTPVILAISAFAALVLRYLCIGKNVLRLRIRNVRFMPVYLRPCILLEISPALMQLTENPVASSFNTSS